MAKKVSKAEFKHSMRKRMVDVSQTKFDSKSKRVTDAKGNLLTGSVDMGGGKTQTYEKGRRVTVSKKMKGFRDAPKKTATKSGSGAGDKKQSKVYEVQKYKQSNAPSAKTGSPSGTTKQTSATKRIGSDSITRTPVPKGTTKRTAKVQNRPRDIGGPARLVTSKDKSKRWVKQVKPTKKTENNIAGFLEWLKRYEG